MKLTQRKLRRLILREFLDLEQRLDQEAAPKDKNSFSLYCFRTNLPMPKSGQLGRDTWSYFYTPDLMLQYLKNDVATVEDDNLYLSHLFGDPQSPETHSKIAARFCGANVDSVVIFDYSGTEFTHQKWSSLSGKNRGRQPIELISYQMIPNVINFNCK